MSETWTAKVKTHPTGSLRFRYGGKERVLILGPAEWHPKNTRHSRASETGPGGGHSWEARWCVPIAVNKSGWGGNRWEPRWWDPEALLTVEEAMDRYADEMSRDVVGAIQKFDGNRIRLLNIEQEWLH